MGKVTRCICHNTSLADLKEDCAARGIATMADFIDQHECARACQLCHPYIAKMLESGQTEFEIE